MTQTPSWCFHRHGNHLENLTAKYCKCNYGFLPVKKQLNYNQWNPKRTSKVSIILASIPYISLDFAVIDLPLESNDSVVIATVPSRLSISKLWEKFLWIFMYEVVLVNKHQWTSLLVKMLIHTQFKGDVTQGLPANYPKSYMIRLCNTAWPSDSCINISTG